MTSKSESNPDDGVSTDELDLPFVITNADREIISYWRPSVQHEEGDGGRAYSDDCALGMVSAWHLIWYLRKYRLDGYEVFRLVVRDMVKAGTWGGREVAFISALGEYMATGRTVFAFGSVAVLNEDAPPTPNGAEAPDPVMPLWREALRLRNLATATDENDEGERSKILDRVLVIEHQIARTQATTVQGLFAKIECRWYIEAPISFEDMKQYSSDALIQGLYEDGARLAAGAGS